MILPNEPADDLSFLDIPPEVESDSDIHSLYERETIQAARVDPVIFIEYVFEWTCWPFQEEWQDLCSKHDRLVLMAPTDHGKSSQISVGRVTWELGRNTDLRIVLLSSTSSLAIKNLGTIKQTILLNHRLRKVFPRLKPEKRSGRTRAWWTDAIIVERSDLTNKDYSIQALGIHGSYEGSRCDLFVPDDMNDMDNTHTQGMRDITIEFLKTTAIPRLTARSRVWAVGTPWHVKDSMHWLEKNPEYFTKRYDAEDGLWPDLQIINGKEVGWPEWRLRQREREIGPIEYARSMRCRALSDTTKIFSIAKFDRCRELDGSATFPYEFHDPNLWTMTGVDLNVKEKSTSNETVFFTVGLGRDGIFRVINIASGRFGIHGILKLMIDVYQRYGPEEFIVEDNQAQSYLSQFIERPKELLEIIGVSGAESILSQIRVVPFTTTAGKKLDPQYGISAMTADFEQEKWRIPRNEETDKWRDEQDSFTLADHPGDRVMASWFVWQRLRERARRQKIRAFTAGGKRSHVQETQSPVAQPQGAPDRGRFRIRAR